MAYEAEKTRLYGLLEQKTGRRLIRNAHLEAEAEERAKEARLQVGLNATGTSSDAIIHDMDMWEELPKGITTYGENATWMYLWPDPILRAAESWWDSAPHKNNLLNPAFTNWGLGIYTELPAGETNELFRRWYIIHLFTNDPFVQPAPIPVIPVGECPANLTPIYNRKIALGVGVNVRIAPKISAGNIDYKTSKIETHNIVGTVPGSSFNGSTKWYAFKSSRGWRYVHTTVASAPVRIE